MMNQKPLKCTACGKLLAIACTKKSFLKRVELNNILGESRFEIKCRGKFQGKKCGFINEIPVIALLISSTEMEVE